MKILSLFSGIGAYEKALEKLGIDFEVVNYCDINQRASICYSILHNVPESLNLQDITKVVPKDLPDFDLLTFSPPCQDISTAGQHAGINEDTRTGLMWDVIPIVKKKQPKYLIMENVQNLAGKYKSTFDQYIDVLSKSGYNCYYEVLCAKDYGIPQNRKRLFLVGIRKDIKLDFTMPKKIELKKELKDFLGYDGKITSINKQIGYTIRIGGRKSKIGNKHNWDGYLINNSPYYLSASDCMRLMGFSNSDYKKLSQAGIIDSAICKVAGNSVVVDVLEHIFRSLFNHKNANR